MIIEKPLRTQSQYPYIICLHIFSMLWYMCYYFDWNIISQQKSNVYNDGCRVGACRMNSSLNNTHIKFCLNKMCIVQYILQRCMRKSV